MWNTTCIRKWLILSKEHGELHRQFLPMFKRDAYQLSIPDKHTPMS